MSKTEINEPNLITAFVAMCEQFPLSKHYFVANCQKFTQSLEEYKGFQ